MENGQNNKIRGIIEEAMRSLKSIAEVNTVVGAPYAGLDGSTIIPVSKVTIAYIAGGGEYSAGENAIDAYAKESYPLSAGSGGFIQLCPIGFLVGKGGELSTISVDGKESAAEKLIKALAEYLERRVKNERK